jgi:hypothetical protein
MEAATEALQGVGVPLYMTEAVLKRYARSVEMLGAKPELPAERAGVDLYARVVPWMLEAERSKPPSGDA